LAGIDLNKARNRHVVDAMVALSTRPGGFTLARVAKAVQQRAGRSFKAYNSRNAAYDLAKLKGKKLLLLVKGSRRYKADPSGVRAMCAYPHSSWCDYRLYDEHSRFCKFSLMREFGVRPRPKANGV